MRQTATEPREAARSTRPDPEDLGDPGLGESSSGHEKPLLEVMGSKEACAWLKGSKGIAI